MMKIPFSPPYHDEEVEREVLAALRSGWITTGPKVREFERLLAETYNIPRVVACHSGTAALQLVLHWWGIGPGDEVIIPAYTYAATALAVIHAGGTPVMVDSGRGYNMDMGQVEKALSHRTRAVIPVDIGGWPADYRALQQVLSAHPFEPANTRQEILGRPLILADAAHSLGAVYRGRKSGRWGDITAFSFHAVKNVTTAEGGAICLNLPLPFDNSREADRLKLWTLNGQTKDAFTKSRAGGWKYDIVYPGFKMNMPDILAAIGLAQFRIYEDKLLPERKRLFARYNDFFAGCAWAGRPPVAGEEKESACHLYMLRLTAGNEQQRDRVLALLAEKGIAANVHFVPLPLLSYFKESGFDGRHFPRAVRAYQKEISLPVYPQLTDGQVAYLLDKVKVAAETALR